MKQQHRVILKMPDHNGRCKWVIESKKPCIRPKIFKYLFRKFYEILIITPSIYASDIKIGDDDDDSD